MIRYVRFEDRVLVIDDEFLDPNGQPIIVEISLEEYKALGEK